MINGPAGSRTVIAQKLMALVGREVFGVVHVGGKRRTVLEDARSLDTSRHIGELSTRDVLFKVPVDTSLNCDRYNNIVSQ